MANKINDVIFHQLNNFDDERGDLTVLYQNNWGLDFDLAQINVVNSRKNTFRGMHLHLHNKDYLFLLKGKMLLGLKDLRRASNTYKNFILHDMDVSKPTVCIVPSGVAHGFYFQEDSLYCYGQSELWDAEEELGFKWNDNQSGIDWPMVDPILSDRDQNAGSVESLLTYLKDNNVNF